MKHTVIWVPKAEQNLATLWMDAADRPIVTEAANEIDRRLRDDPGGAGESRSRGRRILLEPPLGVIFRVYAEDRIVRVLTVWRFQQRGKDEDR